MATMASILARLERIEQRLRLEPELDLDMVRDSFNAESKTPVLACPCHFSVFDVSDGGRVISGPAPHPPQQLHVAVQGNDEFVSR